MKQYQASEVHNRLFFRLFQLGNLLQRQAIKELGITTVQWAVLGALARPSASEGMTFGQLADYLLVSRQNLDGVLKRLEREGYVRRVPHETDKRARIVMLRPEGKQFWEESKGRILEFYEQAMKNFRFDDSVTFVHFLNHLLHDLAEVRLEVRNVVMPTDV